MKILLVEDDIKQYLAIKKYIEENELGQILMDNDTIIDNYEVAIAITRKENPDFAILDLELQQNKGGVEIAKYLYKMKIPFIVLTAYDTPENIEKLKKLKPIAFYYKIDIVNDIRQVKNAILIILSELIKTDNEKFTLKMKKITKPKEENIEWQKTNNKYNDEYNVKPISYNEIKYFKKSPNNKNYCLLITDYKSIDCYEIPHNLKAIELQLPNNFIRLNNETIININEIDYYIDRPLTINLKGKKYIKVTETYQKDVALMLSNQFPFLIKK
jgi:DNA-binding NarL/FixJ family response regulator